MPVYGPTKIGLSTNGVMSSGGSGDFPAESDVRYGVIYNDGTYTGTYYVALPTAITSTVITGIKQDFFVDQYANFLATIRAINTYHSPINLENYAILSTMKVNAESPNTITIESIKTDSVNGEFTIELTSDQTALLDNPSYHYEVRLTENATDDTMRILYGFMRVSRGITHT